MLDDICYCSCHHSSNVHHVMPCCRRCPGCGQNVTDYISHRQKCCPCPDQDEYGDCNKKNCKICRPD
jgi:hypothetical protein